MVQSTLAKLRALEKLCETGYADAVLDRSLEKILAYQRTQLQTHVKELEKELQEFAVRYGMSSTEFLARYQKGELGDSAEVMEWHALSSMHDQLQQQLTLLQESNGGAEHYGISRSDKSAADE
jgi:hypothetical protein